MRQRLSSMGVVGWAAALGTAALLMRLPFLFGTHHVEPGSDESAYLALTHGLFHGKGFQGQHFWTPGYPALSRVCSSCCRDARTTCWWWHSTCWVSRWWSPSWLPRGGSSAARPRWWPGRWRPSAPSWSCTSAPRASRNASAALISVWLVVALVTAMGHGHDWRYSAQLAPLTWMLGSAGACALVSSILALLARSRLESNRPRPKEL